MEAGKNQFWKILWEFLLKTEYSRNWQQIPQSIPVGTFSGRNHLFLIPWRGTRKGSKDTPFKWGSKKGPFINWPRETGVLIPFWPILGYTRERFPGLNRDYLCAGKFFFGKKTPGFAFIGPKKFCFQGVFLGKNCVVFPPKVLGLHNIPRKIGFPEKL